MAQAMLFCILIACWAGLCVADWTGWGGGDTYYDHEYNARASDDTLLNSSSVESLLINCRVDYPLGISSSPSVVNNIAYFPTWNGSFVALDTLSCTELWAINVTSIIYNAAHDYEGITPPSADAAAFVPAVSSTTPQVIDGGIVFFGTMLGALIVSVIASTGQVFNIVQLDSHPYAAVTMSPSYYDGSGAREADPTANAHLLVLVGTDSMEQHAASRVAGYKCCSFVGRMFALQFDGNGLKPLWNVSMIPDTLVKQGWSGVPLSGSQPAVAVAIGGQDIKSKDVFIATGNAYTTSPAASRCYSKVKDSTTTWLDPCIPRSVYADSVLHLNVDTGAVIWVRQLTQINARAAACGDPYNVTNTFPSYAPINQTLCLRAPSMVADAGFEMAPSIVLRIQDVTPGIVENGDTDVIFIGQKNGNLYAFAYDTGATLWATNVGVYGAAAEITGGIAIDDTAVYYTQRWTNTDGHKTFHGSAYGAVNIANGLPKWVVPVPHSALSYNPPTVVGDIVLTGYFDQYSNAGKHHGSGALVALQKATGKVLKELHLGTVFSGGIAIDNGSALFGSGDCWPDANGSFLIAHLT